MAKTKNQTSLQFDYSNPENHPTLISLFAKVKPNITLEEAIEAHKNLFSDMTKPVTDEILTQYFSK